MLGDWLQPVSSGLLQSLQASSIGATAAATATVQQLQGPQLKVRLQSVAVRLGCGLFVVYATGLANTTHSIASGLVDRVNRPW